MSDTPTPDTIRNADSIPADSTTVIIAGSRSATDHLSDSDLEHRIDNALDTAPFSIDVVVSGTAGGVDTAGERWADNHNVTVAEFPAPWDDIDRPGADVRTGQYGKYDNNAGPRRNRWMAQYANAHDGYLLAIIDYPSNGTESMISLARDILGDDRVFVLPIGNNTDAARDEFSDVLLNR